ncbi:hypothetical protein [Schinkia azotoformans]|uniref:hypothetical protein n=1 Tax=Schinkia azotoformans TaxID=1454 RepID=UPI002DB7F46B|nr:hypothetical protein [Schinkia azotoformans]MEC1781679.1 hypothetical protein [Schinkia azotoformans]
MWSRGVIRFDEKYTLFCYTIINRLGLISLEGILNQILQELKDVRHEVSEVKQDLGTVKQEVNELKQGQERLEAKQDQFESNQNRLEAKVDSLISKMRSNFRYTNDRLDEHRKVFEVVASEIKGVKIDIDYLNSKIAKHDMELHNIISKLKS